MLKRSILASALAFALALPALAFAGDGAKGHEGCEHPKAEAKAAAPKDEATYVCPMKCHEQKGPGTCPKCGMQLVKKEPAKK